MQIFLSFHKTLKVYSI